MGVLAKIATERLQLYLDAEVKILTGQSYQIGDRQLTRADLSEVRKAIEYWADLVDTNADGGGASVWRHVPVDD